MSSARLNSETTEVRTQPAPAYTPGPWEIDGTKIMSTVAKNDWDEFVCVIDTRSAMSLNASNDIRLIAAAPDLLEALKGIVADDDASVSLADQRARSEGRMAAAKAAILRATGVSL